MSNLDRFDGYAGELKRQSKTLMELAEETRVDLVRTGEDCGKSHDTDEEDVVDENDCGCDKTSEEDCDCNESTDVVGMDEAFEVELEEEGFATLEEEISDIEESINNLNEVLKLKKTKIADRMKARKYSKSSAGKKAKRDRERDPKFKQKKIKAAKKAKSCGDRNMVWSMKLGKCVKKKEQRK